MFTFSDPLTSAFALTDDLTKRVIDAIRKKDDLPTVSALLTDITLLQAAIEQLVKEKQNG